VGAEDGLPVVSLASAAAWDAWLGEAGPASPGVWLRIARRGAPEPTLSYAEALEEALRHGWIDGRKGALDEHHWLQRFTPRRPGSRWSQRNRDAAERLIADGRMTPAGLAQVEAARADGRWERAYAGAASAVVPDDLRAALDAAPAAAEAFAGLDGANRYAVLYRVHDAKRPETRARRIAGFVEMLARGDRPHP
jgi:uncharacterized protein YdeI (YjbR/CyaY-like superfamily)